MQIFIAIAVGFLLSFFLPAYSFFNLPVHETILYSLLAIGLYGSVNGINLREFQVYRNLIIRAVTFGVIIKSLIIGIIMALIFQTPYAFLFGIIVAQIDPLSVAHLLDEKYKRFSESGKTILRGWASFDDPMTILLALYIFLPLVVNNVVISPQSYIFQLVLNILFAAVIYFINRSIKGNNSVTLILLAMAFFITIPFKLMLGIALVGLFLRPQIKYLPNIIQVAFIMAAFILGSLFTFNTQSMIYGITVGVAAFLAQAIATLLVAPQLNRTDKLFLAVAQYNGITSIILALIIAQWISQTVSIIGFAIITINILYYGTNYLLEKNLNQNIS